MRSAGASKGGRGACSPYRKIAPLGDCVGRPITCMHAPLERSYSTRTTMKRTNFSRRFNKPDLNFQTIYTHSQSSGHIRIQSEIITNIRTASSFIFQHSKKPAKYKNDSQTAKSHLVSQNFYLNLFFVNFPTQELQKSYRGSCLGIRTYPLSKPIFRICHATNCY